jgi:hypothetical protein
MAKVKGPAQVAKDLEREALQYNLGLIDQVLDEEHGVSIPERGWSVIAMYIKDYGDACRVAERVRAHQYEEAREIASMMDTNVREDLSQSFWALMDKEGLG